MPSYKIIVSPSAQQQIMDAEHYVREELGLPKVAEELLASIEDKFSVIALFPNAYPVHEQSSFLSGHQIRCANLKSHHLLYCMQAETYEVRILSLRFDNENPALLRSSVLEGWSKSDEASTDARAF